MKKNIIAMWSGPRNLSTAMMRSFENRQDVIKVIDEPFYGAYLKKFNKKHPLKQDVINSMETNYKEVKNFAKTNPLMVMSIKNICHNISMILIH